MQIIEKMGDFWASLAQIHSQLTFLAIKYPLTIDPERPEDSDGVRVTASVLFPKQKAKSFFTFIFNGEMVTS